MKKFLKAFSKYLLRLFIIFFILSILSVLIFKFVNPPATPLMLIRLTEQVFSDRKIQFKRDYTDLEDINHYMAKAVIASEDQKFSDHWGFDFGAIQKAFRSNQSKNKKSLKGGSTISQQVAKNVFLWPGRSYLRKGLEAYFTILIELLWSKKRIMEVYLNVIETGDGIYGVEAASIYYFKKKAKALSKNEAALIAAVIPNPRRWRPDRPTGYIMKRQSWIIRNMANVEFDVR